MKKLLFFHAPWCPPCRFYEKQFIEPLEEKVGIDKIQRVNVQDESFVADKYQIDKLPAVVLLSDEMVYMNHTGAIDVEEVADWLKKYISADATGRKDLWYFYTYFLGRWCRLIAVKVTSTEITVRRSCGICSKWK